MKTPALRTLLSAALLLSLFGCAEYAPEVVSSSPEGCWRLDAGAWDPPLDETRLRAAARVPHGVELGAAPFLVSVTARDREMHRFDPERAGEARLMLADTTLRAAWWRADGDSVGIGNHNRFAGWYLAAITRGERLRGEMRWVRYAEEGAARGSLHRAPVEGRREDCERLR